MDKPEDIRYQLGALRRLARDFRNTIQSGLDGRHEISAVMASLNLLCQSRDLYSCNAPPVQPLKEFFRSFSKRRRMLHHVLTPSAFLLALLQDLEINEAEAVSLSEEKMVA